MTTSYSTPGASALVLVTILTASLASLVQSADLTLKITSGASTAPVSSHETGAPACLPGLAGACS